MCENLELTEGLQDWPAASVDDLTFFFQQEGIFSQAKCQTSCLQRDRINYLPEYKKKEKAIQISRKIPKLNKRLLI